MYFSDYQRVVLPGRLSRFVIPFVIQNDSALYDQDCDQRSLEVDLFRCAYLEAQWGAANGRATVLGRVMIVGFRIGVGRGDAGVPPR